MIYYTIMPKKKLLSAMGWVDQTKIANRFQEHSNSFQSGESVTVMILSAEGIYAEVSKALGPRWNSGNTKSLVPGSLGDQLRDFGIGIKSFGFTERPSLYQIAAGLHWSDKF